MEHLTLNIAIPDLLENCFIVYTHDKALLVGTVLSIKIGWGLMLTMSKQQIILGSAAAASGTHCLDYTLIKAKEVAPNSCIIVSMMQAVD